MIFHKANSDITLVTEGVIAHGVNCLGVMGAGVALAIRRRWPAAYERYRELVLDLREDQRSSLLGSCHLVRVDESLWVANCFTQNETGGRNGPDAKLWAIERSLRFALGAANSYGVSFHAPQIGAGLGGLDWESEVYPIFETLNNEYDATDFVVHSF